MRRGWPRQRPQQHEFQAHAVLGAPGPDGKPDPAATSPDPLSCQSGNGVSDAADNATLKDGRRVEYGADWMKEGDLANAFSVGQDLPFQSIDGKRDTSLDSQFTVVTTNEIGTFRVGEDGTGERLFEVQTGSEAPGLGCGYRPDAPSMSTCWLVAVPKVGTAGGKYTTGSPCRLPTGQSACRSSSASATSTRVALRAGPHPHGGSELRGRSRRGRQPSASRRTSASASPRSATNRRGSSWRRAARAWPSPPRRQPQTRPTFP